MTIIDNPERAKQAADNYRQQIKLADGVQKIAPATSAASEALGLLRSKLIWSAVEYASEVIMWGGTLDDLKQENTTNG